VIRYRVVEETDHPVIGIAIGAEDGSTVYSINTNWLGAKTERLGAGSVVEMRVPFVATLPNGRYAVRAGAGNRDMTKYHDLVDNVFRFVVHGSPCRHGSTDLQGAITYQVLAGDAEEEESAKLVVAGQMERDPRTQKVGGRR
jgi:hypothetical protein